jgi:fatty-acyl-CoA synthase
MTRDEAERRRWDFFNSLLGGWPEGIIMNVSDWVSRRSRLHPEKEAIVFGELRLTYRDLNDRVNRVTRALRKMGLRKGDRLAIFSLNSNAFLETVFACARFGVILVPINFRLAPPEIEHILRDSGACALLTDTNLLGMIEESIDRVGIDRLIVEGKSPAARGTAFEDLIEGQPTEAPSIEEPIGGRDPFSLMYTSGTTGTPKGAILTHDNLFWNAVNSMHGFELDAHTRFLISVPLFHAGGLNGGAIPTLYAGGTIVLESFFHPEKTLEQVEKEKITFLGGVPVMFQLMLDLPSFDRVDLSSVKTIMAGAMPVPVPLIEAYRKKNVTFQQSYGLTEATSSVLYLRHEDALRKVGSAGKPFLHVDVRIVNEEGKGVRPGETGEILVRGGNVMKGYWQRPEETAEAIQNGWLRTGDMADMDEEGFVFIRDRKRDLIISGGENVYPAEVESVLCRHPKVSEVSVIAVPDPKWGESVRAVIVPKAGEEPTLEDIHDFCETRLAKYKRPRSIVLVDELPKNALGKVLRKVLREEYAK